MNAERDPLLESLFEQAEEDLLDENFTGEVVRHMQDRRKRILSGRFAVIAMLVLLEVLLESPMQQSLGVVADVLGTSLITLEGEWVSFVLGPVNSIAGLVGIVLLGIHGLYRKIVY